MKKLLTTMILAASLFSVSCSNNTTMLSQEQISGNTNYSMFIKVESTSIYDIVYHSETKVMYAISRGTYAQGIFTVLLDADGSPMLYSD